MQIPQAVWQPLWRTAARYRRHRSHRARPWRGRGLRGLQEEEGARGLRGERGQVLEAVPGGGLGHLPDAEVGEQHRDAGGEGRGVPAPGAGRRAGRGEFTINSKPVSDVWQYTVDESFT